MDFNEFFRFQKSTDRKYISDWLRAQSLIRLSRGRDAPYCNPITRAMAILAMPAHGRDVRANSPRSAHALTFVPPLCKNPPMDNPFSSPWPGGEAAPPSPPPSYSLFDSVSVAIATLFGSPIAGTILMAVNYHRLGKGGKAVAAVAIGLAATILAGLFGYRIPTALSSIIAIGLLLLTKSCAVALQGPAVTQHVSQGGKLGSRWAE
jgi:hypothetical protein